MPRHVGDFYPQNANENEESEGQNDAKTAQSVETNTDIHLVPMEVGFAGNFLFVRGVVIMKHHQAFIDSGWGSVGCSN